MPSGRHCSARRGGSGAGHLGMARVLREDGDGGAFPLDWGCHSQFHSPFSATPGKRGSSPDSAARRGITPDEVRVHKRPCFDRGSTLPRTTGGESASHRPKAPAALARRPYAFGSRPQARHPSWKRTISSQPCSRSGVSSDECRSQELAMAANEVSRLDLGSGDLEKRPP